MIGGADYPGMGMVAEVNLCRVNLENKEDGKANALLIVAAPDTLSMMRVLWEEHCADGESHEKCLVCRDVVAVLSKTEGR